MTAVAVRLVRLHASSRRLPAALALLAACAAGLRGTLYGHWDDYGALQLPLIFEAACAAIIAVMAGSPFGEPERATGRWLPYLRLGTAVALTGLACGALAAAGTGMPLAGGFADIVRNVAGLTGIGLLCATVLGGPLAALLHDATGSWLPVFGIIIALDILTGVLALAVLKPMRRAYSP